MSIGQISNGNGMASALNAIRDIELTQKSQDLVEQTVKNVEAETALKANKAVLNTMEENLGTVLDLKA